MHRAPWTPTLRLANNTVVSRPLAVLVVPPAGRVPPHCSARGAAGKTSSAEVGTMDPIYLVWDATDSAGGGLDGDGNVKRQGRNVLIRFDRDQACELAVQVYKTDGVGQLVIELTQDGTRKVVSFVGELEDGLC